jgi:hypothetical protein
MEEIGIGNLIITEISLSKEFYNAAESEMNAYLSVIP